MALDYVQISPPRQEPTGGNSFNTEIKLHVLNVSDQSETIDSQENRIQVQTPMGQTSSPVLSDKNQETLRKRQHQISQQNSKDNGSVGHSPELYMRIASESKRNGDVCNDKFLIPDTRISSYHAVTNEEEKEYTEVKTANSVPSPCHVTSDITTAPLPPFAVQAHPNNFSYVDSTDLINGIHCPFRY